MSNSPSVPLLLADLYHNLTACYLERNVASAIGEWIFQDQAPKDFASTYFNSIKNMAEQSNYYGGRKPINLLIFLPNELLQLIAIVVLSHVLHLFLRHLRQSRFISQIISGTLIYLVWNKGTHDDDVDHYQYFPTPKHHRLHYEFTSIGIIYNFFLVGVKMDVGSTWHGGKNPLIIGLVSIYVPMAVTAFIYLLVYNQISYHVNNTNNFMQNVLDILVRPSDNLMLFLMATLCHSYFGIQAEVLSDLGLLSSELGRLSLSASLIQDLMLYCLIPVFSSTIQSQIGTKSVFMHLLLFAIMVLFITFIIRPYALWIVRSTPSHAHVSEVHITCITFLVITMALASDIVGAPFIIGPFFMGLALPSGPPLGTALITRIDLVATELLLPLSFLCFGNQMDWVAASHERHNFWYVFLMLVSSIVKIVAVTLAALYCGISLKKGALLGLIMNFKGTMEILLVIDFLYGRAINRATFTYLVSTIVITTSVSTLLVSIFYKPLDEEIHVCKNVGDLRAKSELRIITCFFNDNPIPSLLNIFEWLTSSMAQHYTCIYALHIKELKANSKSNLISHHIGKNKIDMKEMDPIHFHLLNFAKENDERITTLPFTSIVPQENLHQDIYALIAQRNITLILLPFPRKKSMASTEADQREYSLIPLVLEQAHCSIGIMVYQNMTRVTCIMRGQKYRIGVLFLGGPDDREAVAIAGRMVYHPFVHLRILCICTLSGTGGEGDELEDLQTRENILDIEAINQIQTENTGNNRLTISEVTINDMLQIFPVISSLKENYYDLLIVGRRRAQSSLLYNKTLEEWTESPELGVIGDQLASPDFKTSAIILVVQQYGLN